MTYKAIICVLFGAVLSWVAFHWFESGAERSPDAVPSTIGLKMTSNDAHQASQSPLGQPLITADELLVGGAVSVDGKELTLSYEETLPGTTSRENWSSHYGTTFQITAFGARQSNEILVAGTTSANENVIEKWTNGEQKGAQFLHVSPSQTVIGVPLSPVPQVLSGVVGGQYIPIAARTGKQRQQREELYRGSLCNKIISIAPDPEGRFFVVLTDSPRAVYRFAPPSQVPTLVCEVSTLPELSTVELGFMVSQHTLEGRLLFLTCNGPAPGSVDVTYIKIYDSDNDGNFEGASIMSDAQFLAEGSNPVWLQPDFLDFSGY